MFGRRKPETTSTAWDAPRTDRASRKRRESHRRTGADRAARKGQAWEDADRLRERYR